MKPNTTMEDLPDPIIEYILSYLSPYRDLKQCMQVNKSWYRYVHDVIRKTQRDFFNAVCHMSVQWCHLEAEPGPTITKRYSHSACCSGNSMYIFGGCTTANTTFNDLWRLDLGTRCWIRPLATGTYPPPKACATLVSHSDNLVLFGGWTHTAPYPLHQIWRAFNQIHVYNTTTNRWTQVTSVTTCPPMAGHSATVHGDYMVVFGGIQKQVCDGPCQSSSDVWTLDLKSYKWQKQVSSTDSPPPRYGHSQIPIDKHHLLIMGGCGGANMLYTDIWLLKMIGGPGGLWEWQRMDIQSKENGAPHLAFHPACKVGNLVVVMNKAQRSRSSPATLPKLIHNPARNRTWTPPRLEEYSMTVRHAKRPAPEIEQCVNGKRGVLKRPVDRKNIAKSNQVSSSDEEELLDTGKRVALHVTINSNPPQSHSLPSTSGAANNLNSHSSSPFAKPPMVHASQETAGVSRNLIACDLLQEAARKSGQNSTSGASLHVRRTRRLEVLDRMTQRLEALQAGKPPIKSRQVFIKHKSTVVMKKRPMCMYVLDITTALEGYVTWRTLKNQSLAAPEEIILYSLVLGKGELIMFGGIQKDLNSQDQDSDTVPEIVSNCLHFMTAERFVI